MADQTPISSASYSSMADTQNYDFANLVFINVATQATIRLTPDNFFTWKAQWDALLYGYALTGYVDGSLPCPSPSSNLAYLFWTRKDHLLFGSLLASLSPDLASMVLSAKTSRELWSKLCLIYAKPSRSRIIRLREKLVQPQGSCSITTYMFEIKAAADELPLLDEPLKDEEITIYVLKGLNPDLKGISAALRSGDTEISFEDLHERLLEYEANIHKSDIHTPHDIISIDHQMYREAAIGQISAFEQHKDRLHLLLTRGISVILKKRKELCRVADDEKGWGPLHYAANRGNIDALEVLLEYDPFAAGIKDKNGQIPLQVIADPKICRSFIREIMSWSPDCCESLLVDENFYHDDHAATEFDKITKQDRRIIRAFDLNFMEFEGETKNAFKIWTKAFNDRKKPDKKKSLDKDSTLVVAALIATVTFAAGFTIPGGYLSGGDNLPSNAGSQPGAAGSAVLSENAAFKAFLISDAIAMALSSCAVFIHMFLALKKDRTKDSSYFLLAFKLIIVAMVVMVIAFMTGIYAALGSSNAFAIASCVFISVSFLLCILYLTFGYFTDSVYYFLRECAFCILSTFGYIFVRPIVLPIVLAMDYYDDYKNWRRRGQLDKDSQQENSTEYTEQEGDPPPKSNDSRNLETLPESNVNPRTPSINEESAKSLKNANYLEAEKGHDAV